MENAQIDQNLAWISQNESTSIVSFCGKRLQFSRQTGRIHDTHISKMYWSSFIRQLNDHKNHDIDTYPCSWWIMNLNFAWLQFGSILLRMIWFESVTRFELFLKMKNYQNSQCHHEKPEKQPLDMRMIDESASYLNQLDSLPNGRKSSRNWFRFPKYSKRLFLEAILNGKAIGIIYNN